MKLNREIRAGLKRDGIALQKSLLTKVADGQALEASLGKISALLEQETHFVEERKKLSRQVGEMRKNNDDPAELIAQIAQISGEVKKLSAQVDQQVLHIEAGLVDSGDSVRSPGLPLHLQRPDIVLECDVESLGLEHSDSIDESEWQSFVDSVPHSTVYHHANWCRLIEKNFKHRPYYIACRKPGGELCGVLPLIHLDSRLFGSFMVSMPYFNYGGPLSKHRAVEQKLMEYAAKVSADLECTHMEVRETAERENWLTKQHKVTMILPLPQSDQELDKRLGSKVRAQVNRAARHDLEFSLGGVELLKPYYKVFSQNMRDLGTPVYSQSFFASILDCFSDKASIAVVRHNDQPVAAGFLLGHNDKLEIPWASSLRSANPLGANMYMYRQILRTAVEGGYKYFDFGRSSKGASTYQYKKQWGAVEHPLYWHYALNGADELPELNPDNPKYKLAIKAWQKLPIVVANAVGPRLVRNLP